MSSQSQRELLSSAAISEEALWRTERANRFKTKLCTCGGICGTITIITWVVIMVSLATVSTSFPFFPDGLLNYGWILHLFNAPVVALCYVAGGVHNKEVIAIIGFLAIGVTLLNGWVVAGNFLPWLVGCITANPITFFADCSTGSALYSFMMLAVSILFVIISLIVLYASFSLYNYISTGQMNIYYAVNASKQD